MGKRQDVRNVPVTVRSSTRIKNGKPTKILELDLPIAEVLVPVEKSAKRDQRQFVKVPFQCKIVGYDDLFEPVDCKQSKSKGSISSCLTPCSSGGTLSRGAGDSSRNASSREFQGPSSSSRPSSDSFSQPSRGSLASSPYYEQDRPFSTKSKRDQRKRMKEEEKQRKKEEKRRKNEIKKREKEMKKLLKRLDKLRKEDAKNRKRSNRTRSTSRESTSCCGSKSRDSRQKRQRMERAPSYSSSRDFEDPCASSRGSEASLPSRRNLNRDGPYGSNRDNCKRLKEEERMRKKDEKRRKIEQKKEMRRLEKQRKQEEKRRRAEEKERKKMRRRGKSPSRSSSQGFICTKRNRCFAVSPDEMCECQCPECCCRPSSAMSGRPVADQNQVPRSISSPDYGPGREPVCGKRRKDPRRPRSLGIDSDPGSDRECRNPEIGIRPSFQSIPDQPVRGKVKKKPSGLCCAGGEKGRDGGPRATPERPCRDTSNVPITKKPRKREPSPGFFERYKICMKNNLFAGTQTKSGKNVDNRCTYEEDLVPPVIGDDGRPAPRGKCFMKRCRDNRIFPRRTKRGKDDRRLLRGDSIRDSKDSIRDSLRKQNFADQERRQKLADQQAMDRQLLADQAQDIERARREAICAAEAAIEANRIAEQKAQVAKDKENILRRLLGMKKGKKSRNPRSSSSYTIPTSNMSSEYGRTSPDQGWYSTYGKGRLGDSPSQQYYDSKQQASCCGGRGAGYGDDGSGYGGRGAGYGDDGSGYGGRGAGCPIDGAGYGSGDEDSRFRYGADQDSRPARKGFLDRLCGGKKPKKIGKESQARLQSPNPSQQTITWNEKPPSRKSSCSSLCTPGKSPSSRGSLASRPSASSISSADPALVNDLDAKPGLLSSLRNMLFSCGSTCTQSPKPSDMCQEVNGTFRIVGDVESGRIDLFVDDATKRKLKCALQELNRRAEAYAQSNEGIKNSQFKKY